MSHYEQPDHPPGLIFPYDILKEQKVRGERLAAELADLKHDLQRYQERDVQYLARIEALEAALRFIAQGYSDCQSPDANCHSRHAAEALGLIAETGLPAETDAERKLSPEHQAQMKWARDVVSRVVIPPADEETDGFPLTEAEQKSVDRDLFPPTHSESETACDDLWHCVCGCTVRKSLRCLCGGREDNSASDRTAK